MPLRRLVGWMVATAYAATLARRRALARISRFGCLPVVVHALPAAELEKILAWLKSHGALERLWLSFDDGWTTLPDCVPVLERFGVRAKVFIAPGQTLRGTIWTNEAAQRGVPPQVWRGWRHFDEKKRNALLDSWRRDGFSPERRLLGKEQVVALSRHPLLEIENHTWSHLSATHRPVEEVVSEVERTQRTLEEWTGRTPEMVAWPFGRGNAELDARMGRLDLTALYTRQGYKLPRCRNMAIEGVSFRENLGRILGAWPKVGETL